MNVRVRQGDALEIPADVLVLKYAQALHGVDKLVVERLEATGAEVRSILPKLGEFQLIDTGGHLGAKSVLFVGVTSLLAFEYQAIREFGKRALTSLAGATPAASHVAFTLHGTFLDESEAFRAELAGIFDALATGEYPAGLRLLTFVEHNADRVCRLATLLDALVPEPVGDAAIQRAILNAQTEPLRPIELYLVCHGDAVESSSAWPQDDDRPLTPEGIAKFRQVVDALQTLNLTIDVILTSPAKRARQSAELLAVGLSQQPPIQILESLAPGGSYEMFLKDLGSQERRRHLACVGHQRALGRLAAQLAGIRHRLRFEHGAVCRVDLDVRGPGHLVWFAPPSILRHQLSDR